MGDLPEVSPFIPQKGGGINTPGVKGICYCYGFVIIRCCDKTLGKALQVGTYGSRGNFRARQYFVKDAG
jgi:hypothetical protein